MMRDGWMLVSGVWSVVTIPVVAQKDSDMILCFVYPASVILERKLVYRRIWSAQSWTCYYKRFVVDSSEVMDSSRHQGVRNERVVQSAKNKGTEEVKCDNEKSRKLTYTLCVQNKEEQMLTNQVSTYCNCYNMDLHSRVWTSAYYVRKCSF